MFVKLEREGGREEVDLSCLQNITIIIIFSERLTSLLTS